MLMGSNWIMNWVREHYATKGEVQLDSERYWKLVNKIDALYNHLGLELTHCPGKNIVAKKGVKAPCQQ